MRFVIKKLSDDLNRVGVVGNCIVDQVMIIPAFPQQDDEFRALQSYRSVGGNACNSARVLAKLGHPVDLMASMANDPESDWLLQQLHAKGVATGLCPRLHGQSTPLSSIWLNQENGSRTIAHYRELAELSVQQLSRLQDNRFAWIHFEGRNIEVLSQFFKGSKGLNNTPFSLELEKARPGIELLLPYISTAIVSSHYLKHNEESAEQCMERLRSINPGMNIVCTLGENGLLAMDSAGNMISIAAQPVTKVVDSIGAGDCFIAGLISGLVKGEDFEQALEYANQLAALKIQQRGFAFNV